MGNLITSIYLNTPGYLRSDKEFRKAIGRIKEIRGRKMRENLDNIDVIISTSGMLDGGPVLSYIEKYVNDPKSAIFMTGYQAENTNGRSLVTMISWLFTNFHMVDPGIWPAEYGVISLSM